MTAKTRTQMKMDDFGALQLPAAKAPSRLIKSSNMVNRIERIHIFRLATLLLRSKMTKTRDAAKAVALQ
jgi:hypothetical protein